MKIETKYEINQRIWIVYENKGEVCIYDDIISEIAINNDKLYYITETSCVELDEKEIICYNDTIKLLNAIIKTMEEIRKKEPKIKNE